MFEHQFNFEENTLLVFLKNESKLLFQCMTKLYFLNIFLK